MVPSEIKYTDKRGRTVHSDLDGDPNDPQWRHFIHDCLDEWLDKSNGTGVFYVGDVVELLALNSE